MGVRRGDRESGRSEPSMRRRAQRSRRAPSRCSCRPWLVNVCGIADLVRVVRRDPDPRVYHRQRLARSVSRACTSDRSDRRGSAPGRSWGPQRAVPLVEPGRHAADKRKRARRSSCRTRLIKLSWSPESESAVSTVSRRSIDLSRFSVTTGPNASPATDTLSTTVTGATASTMPGGHPGPLKTQMSVVVSSTAAALIFVALGAVAVC